MPEYTFLDCKEINKQVQEAKLAEQEGGVFSEVRGEGVALVKDISSGFTTTNKPKFTGNLANLDVAEFNVWSNSAAFRTISENEIVPGETFVFVRYSISKFGFVIEYLEVIEDAELNPEDFIYQKYKIQDKNVEYLEALKNSGASARAVEVINEILGIGTGNYMHKRFSHEQAALNNHDNCMTGLLAHTIKCLRIYNGIKDIYKNIFGDKVVNDLMVIGLIIHDCGKVYEMYNGAYQKYSYVSHRGLGAEHLSKYKDYITEKYDEDFYYMLYSIIMQHHDVYGDPAKTLYAFIAHQIDNIDAILTSIDEIIENGTYTEDMSGTKIRFGDRYFNIRKASDDNNQENTQDLVG